MNSIRYLEHLGYNCYSPTTANDIEGVWVVDTSMGNLIRELKEGGYSIGGASANDAIPLIRVY